MNVPCNASRRARVLSAIAVAIMMAAASAAGAAQAASSPHSPGVIVQPVTGPHRPGAAAKPKKCFYTFPDCASPNPDVQFRIVSVGDTTGCTFKDTAKWGDGTSETKTFSGGADGAILATFKHGYAADAASTYNGLASGETTVGTCTNFPPTAFQFTLTGCRNALAASGATAPTGPARVSGNWAGYVAGSLTSCLTRVTGQWVMPAVTCPKSDEGTLEVDFWVGLDGDAHIDPTVEQTGIEVQCRWDASGRNYVPHYRAWYEMYPHHPVYEEHGFGTLDPRSDSTIKATVAYTDKRLYDLSLTVTTGDKKQAAQTSQACPAGSSCKNVTAEWVVEKVAGLSLASFAPWHLTNGFAATAADPPDRAVESFDPTALDLERDKKILARTCGLREASFTVQQAPC
jgi:hypothetical protein